MCRTGEDSRVESRTRFVIGGMSTVAASVAVICAVALTNSIALSEAAGSAIDAAPVVVPSSNIAETTETPAASPADADAPVTPVAEVVPAPAPEVVSPRKGAPVAEQSAGAAHGPSEDEVIADAEASGSWDSAREWAAGLGWSQERIDAWIARLERSRGSVSDRSHEGSTDEGKRAELGDESDRGSSGDFKRSFVGDYEGGSADEFGNDGSLGDAQRAPQGDSHRRLQDAGTDRRVSEPESSTATTPGEPVVTDSPQERPAQAGADADSQSMKPGVGAKEDRSRDSPDRSDR